MPRTLVSKHRYSIKATRDLGEMADSRAGVGKIQDELAVGEKGQFLLTEFQVIKAQGRRKTGNHH